MARKPRKGSIADIVQAAVKVHRSGKSDALEEAKRLLEQPRNVLSIRATAETRRLLMLLAARLGVRGSGEVVAVAVREMAERLGVR